MEDVHKLIKVRQNPRAAKADVYSGLGDPSDLFMLVRVRHDYVKLWTRAVNGQYIKTVRFSSY